MTNLPIALPLAALKALADATRLKLIALIADDEHSVGDIAKRLKLKEPTISHHLAKLQEADLVIMRTEGTTHFYKLNAEALRNAGKAFAIPVSHPEATSQSTEPVVNKHKEQKILNTYVQDGTLTKIPDKRKKRDVILHWLVQQFEVGKSYPEPKLNEMLKKIHPDFATLRRELIMAKLMERENNIYWRT